MSRSLPCRLSGRVFDDARGAGGDEAEWPFGAACGGAEAEIFLALVSADELA